MIRFFCVHPTAANLLMLALGVIGLLSIGDLRRETFPEFATTELLIHVEYPGASAETVEETVVTRVEDAIEGIEGVAEIVAEARENVALVTVEMDPGTDVPTFVSDVNSQLATISDFPPQVESPIVERVGTTDPVVSIAVTGPMSEADLKAYCEQLRRRLTHYGEVSQVEVDGFSDHQLRVHLRRSAVAQYGLSVSDVAQIIAAQSLDLPAGTVETRYGDVFVRFHEERRNVQGYADLVVLADPGGGVVRLGEIADIQERFSPVEAKVTFDGQRAGLLRVLRSSDEDALTVLAGVKSFLDEVRETKPPGVELTLTEDMTSVVSDRLRLLLVNGYQGLILVFLTLWLFFTPRLATWVAAGLPVSFLGALFVMAQIGYTLNMMTMLALLLALGLLMDDAIVLAENVASHHRRGRTGIEAAIEGVSEVGVGVVSSFATTVCVFAPLAFLDGEVGRVLLVVPVVLIIVLAVSLLEAFLILPNHLGHSFDKEPSAKSRRRARFDAWFEWVRQDVVGRVIDACVERRYAVFGSVVGLLLLSLGLLSGGVLKFQAFPDIDGNVAQLRLLLPQGTPLATTETVVDHAIAALRAVEEELQPRQPEGAKLVQSISVQYGENVSAGETGPHAATISVDLLPTETRDARIDELTGLWRARFGAVPDVVSAEFGSPGVGPAGKAIEVRVQGERLDELAEVAREIERFFAQFDGVYDLGSDLRPGKPELQVRLRSGALGVDVQGQALADQLRAAFAGKTAKEVQVGSEGYEVVVQLAGRDAQTLDDIEHFRITTRGGDQVPLTSIAILESTRGYSKISHVDGERTVTVSGSIRPGVTNAAELIDAFVNQLEVDLMARHPHVRLSIEGEHASSAETMGSMVRGLTIGLFGIFVLLSFQFGSYLEPLIVMVAIPMSLIGVIWGNLAMGDPLTMPGMLGFVSLAGVVVNDSILLVEFMKLERRRGATVLDAARLAGRSRFRAVFLTSSTTIAGLVPLLFESSPQAQVLIPVATSIVFGITASTLLVLLAIPAMYAILGDLGWLSLERSHE